MTVHANAGIWSARDGYDDLVRESLQAILPVLLGGAWLWTSYTALFQVSRAWPSFLAFAFLLAGSVACYTLQRHRLPAAVSLYLVGMAAAVTLMAVFTPHTGILYLYIPVVLVASVVSSTRLLVFTASISCLLIWYIGRIHGFLFPDFIPAILVTGFTVLAAWLATQRQKTALAWAMQMYEIAQANAAEAREQRAELHRALRTLDIAYTRVERANQALIFAQDAADRAYRFKSDFVANVSHELRTPLNLVIGFSEMMTMAPESYGGVPLPREYRGDMMAVYRSARHLLALINDVLDLSQIEAGKMSVARHHTNLNELVDEAAGMVRGLADVQGLALRLSLPEPPLWVELDRTRIRQVLLNLLTNAMRYTDQGYVEVRACAEDGMAQITVADSGRGIDQESLKHAFQAFTRLDEQAVREGSGLGLAVSMKFVELHGGKIWIESQLGRGTQVHFTLPLPHSDTLPLVPVRRSQTLPDRIGKPIALVLHDDERVVTTLRRHVTTAEFVHAPTLDAAIAAIHAEQPGVLLYDDGQTARYSELIQRFPSAAQLPTVVCPLPSMRLMGLMMGATDYLPKPVSRQDLAAALSRLPQWPAQALVVDDDPHIVRLITRMLRSVDPSLQVMEAYRGDDALAAARANPPDVIFLDLVMPEMDGYQLLELLHEEASLANTATVIVSVRSAEQEMQPLPGEIRVGRPAGMTLTEMLNLLDTVLPVLTQPDTVSPTSAAARLEAVTG